MVILRVQGILTPMERYALAQEQNCIELVKPLRQKVFSLMQPDIIFKIEETTGTKVIQVCSEILWERDEQYCMIVLNQDIR